MSEINQLEAWLAQEREVTARLDAGPGPGVGSGPGATPRGRPSSAPAEAKPT